MIDAFIDIKRRQELVRLYLGAILVSRKVKFVWDAYNDFKAKRVRKYLAARLSLILYIKLKKAITRKGGLSNVTKKKIQNSCTFFTNSVHPIYYNLEIKKVFNWFFVEKLVIDDLINKGRRFH